MQSLKRRRTESNDHEVGLIGDHSLNCGWLAKLDEARMEMMNEYQESINEAENKNHELEKSIEKCLDLTKQNDEMKKQIEELKESDENSKRIIEDLKTDNEELLAENEDMTPKIDELKIENVGLKTGIEELKVQNGDLKSKNEALKSSNEGLKSQIEDLESQNKDLKAKLEVSTETNNKYGWFIHHIFNIFQGINTCIFILERKFGLPHCIEIKCHAFSSIISNVCNRVFKLDGWNEKYPIFKATAKYGDEDVYLVHD